MLLSRPRPSGQSRSQGTRYLNCCRNRMGECFNIALLCECSQQILTTICFDATSNNTMLSSRDGLTSAAPPPSSPLLSCGPPLPPPNTCMGGGQASKGWCRRTRCETTQLQASVPWLQEHKAAACYSLFGESQLILWPFLSYSSRVLHKFYTAQQYSFQGTSRPLLTSE